MRAHPLVAVEGGDAGHLVVGELEVEHVEVRGDALDVVGLGDGHDAALDLPPQGGLHGVLAVGRTDLGEHRVVGDLAPGDGAPRLGDDAVEVVEVAHLVLLEVRVQLDLVQHRDHAGGLDDATQVLGLEVRHADRGQAPARPELEEGLPGLEVAVVLRRRPVDQQQVEAIEAELLHARLERLDGVLTALAPDLGGDVQLVAGDARLGDGTADALLVEVAPGGVDRAVAQAQRLADDAGGLVGGHLEHPEADQRHRRAVVEVDPRKVGCGAHRSPCSSSRAPIIAAQPRPASMRSSRAGNSAMSVNASAPSASSTAAGVMAA